jgi:hypothetical protein
LMIESVCLGVIHVYAFLLGRILFNIYLPFSYK